MALFTLRDGQTFLWEPTTALICSGCREDLALSTHRAKALGSINFMFDLRHPSGDALAYGEYWYLHKRCSHLEEILLHEGIQVAWGWHSMSWVLGTDKALSPYFGRLDLHLKKHMPVGVYDRLYTQWAPALRPFKSVPLSRHKGPQAKPSRDVRPGAVYLLQAEGTSRIKIGRSSAAMVRMDALHTASPFPLIPLRVIQVKDAVALEKVLHRRYAPYRRHREWFELPPAVLQALLVEDFA